MTSHIQFLHMKNHEWNEEFIREKLDKLESKYSWITQAKVIFKVDKGATLNQNTCEIELSVPGPRLFAKSSADSFEASVMKTVEQLDRLLKKRKAKMYQH